MHNKQAGAITASACQLSYLINRDEERGGHDRNENVFHCFTGKKETNELNRK
jgi:hypothetical protein